MRPMTTPDALNAVKTPELTSKRGFVVDLDEESGKFEGILELPWSESKKSKKTLTSIA